MTVDLSPRLGALIQEKVASGEYPTPEAVVAAALRLLQMRDDEAKLERLRAAVKRGFDELERGEGALYSPDLHDQIIISARRRAREGDVPNPDVLP